MKNFLIILLNLYRYINFIICLNFKFYLQHYKREADGLCHRLVTPVVSAEFKLFCEATSNEKGALEFERAKLLISKSEVKFGDIIGHGEFGGVFFLIFIEKNKQKIEF